MGRFEGESCGSYLLYIMSSSDYARNLNGKRPVRSRRLKPYVIRSRRFHRWRRFRPVRSWNRNCMMCSPTDFKDLELFGLWDDADFSSSNTQKNLCKSVKSVGQKNVKSWNLRDLITCGLSRQLHEFCVKFIKKIHGNVGDYKYFVTFALDYENMN